MPDITNIEVNYSRKVQLDDFEPVQHSVTLHAELASGEDPNEAYDALADDAEQMVEEAIARRITQKKLADDTDDEE
jgi:hypothetical protein